MTDPLQVRSSALPMAFICPASIRPPAIVIRESGPAADVGTATHEALRPLVEFGDLDWETVIATAEHHSADVVEVRMLVAQAVKIWRKLSKYFPHARTETFWRWDGGSYILTGHTDVDSIVDDGEEVRTLDWKTGRKDYDYSEQMKGYCALSMLETGASESSSTIAWVRDKEIEQYTMTYEQMRGWLERLEKRVVQWDGVYHPGEHCRFCPRDHECEARTAMVRASAAPFAMGDQTEDMTQWTPEKFHRVWNKVAVVLHYTKQMDKVMRDHVKRHGPIRLGEREIVAVEETRREIDPIAAWDTLVALGLYNDDLQKILRVSKDALEQVIRDKTSRGKKAIAVRSALSEIERAGAMKRKTTHKVVSRRIKESIDEEE